MKIKSSCWAAPHKLELTEEIGEDITCQSVKSQRWPLIPSCQQAEWEKQRASREKGRHRRSDYGRLFFSTLTKQGRSQKEMTVLASLPLIGPSMFVTCTRLHVCTVTGKEKPTEDGAGQDQTRYFLPAETGVPVGRISHYFPRNIQKKKSTIMQKNTFYM